MSFARFASATSPLAYRPPPRPKSQKKKELLLEPYPIGTRLRITGHPDEHRRNAGREFIVQRVDHSAFPSHGPYWYAQDQGDPCAMWSNFVEVVSDES